MRYRGISRWTQEVNDEMKACLVGIDYDTLSESEQKAYRRFQEDIRIFESGRDPLMDAGFVYAPYVPLGFECQTVIEAMHDVQAEPELKQILDKEKKDVGE